MASKDRVFIDKEILDYAKQSEVLPDDRMDQFFVFMGLGFKERRKEPVAPGKKRQEMFLTHQRLPSLDEKLSLIYALALYDKNLEYFEDKKRNIKSDKKFVNLNDEKEMYDIVEQYANGGAYYLKELEENTSLDDKHVLEKEIKKYLRKISEK